MAVIHGLSGVAVLSQRDASGTSRIKTSLLPTLMVRTSSQSWTFAPSGQEASWYCHLYHLHHPYEMQLYLPL